MSQMILWPENETLTTESELVSVALALGAERVAGWSKQEGVFSQNAAPAPKQLVDDFQARINDGQDPLGDAFCKMRSQAKRRQNGATYTPLPIVQAMIDWAADVSGATQVIDPGTGSGRYLIAAGRRFHSANLVGVEIDPLAAILARANLAASGLARRSQIIVADYREVEIPKSRKTLFIGNPPYVRHHMIHSKWKRWLTTEATKLGQSASQLAGLHIHFFLATASKAQRGDFGAFITAGEWLDVNYGSVLRKLFLTTLGGCRLDVIEPRVKPFPNATTTGVISFFQVGAKPNSIRVNRIEDMDQMNGKQPTFAVRRQRLETERRWSHLTRPARKPPAGYVELGEICRVHRGQVTGCNKVWIAVPGTTALPADVLFPCVTKARDLFVAGRRLLDTSLLRRVIDLPVELDIFDKRDRRKIELFLSEAKALGADRGYVATNRKAWWSVGLREPAPILTTYMARRPPAFVHNKAGARHINIAHGLYPREPISTRTLEKLTDYLSSSVRLGDGRTYAGGLTKFEPREVERLMVPNLELLAAD